MRMKIRIQPVAGGHYDFAEFRCDCGRVARIGVGENNWEEQVDEKGRPTEENPVSEELPKCYGNYESDDPLCQFGCYWSNSCQAKKTAGSIGVPHTNEELERIRSKEKGK